MRPLLLAQATSTPLGSRKLSVRFRARRVALVRLTPPLNESMVSFSVTAVLQLEYVTLAGQGFVNMPRLYVPRTASVQVSRRQSKTGRRSA